MNLWITNDWSGGRAFLLSVNISSSQFVSIPTQTICCSNKVEFFIISLESFFAAMTAAQFVPTLSQTGCSNHFVYFFMNCHWQRHSIFIRLKIYLLFFYIFQFHSFFLWSVNDSSAQFVPNPSRLDIAQIYSMAAIPNENWYFYLSQKIAQHRRKSETVDLIALILIADINSYIWQKYIFEILFSIFIFNP